MLIIKAHLSMYMSLAALAATPAMAAAQKSHQVRVEANREKDIYRFVPQRITVKYGDVIVFKAISGAPHSVVFEAEDLPPAVRRLLGTALSARPGELASSIIAKNGAEYRLVLPKLPAGTYRFFCLPHRAYDMRGEIVVKD